MAPIVEPVLETPTTVRNSRRSRAVLVWALVGIIWTAVCIKTIGGWLGSDDFGRVSPLGPDEMPSGKLIALRVVEAMSTGVLVVSVWFLAIRPWLQTRKVTVDALLLIGGLVGFVMDCWLNLYSFLFAFNANSVNLGAWSAFLPFHNEDVPSRYAESLLWGLPMYIYFFAALGFVGTIAARKLRLRYPALSTQGIFAILFVGDFIFDFTVENIIIRTTEAYSFVQTNESLTLWAGSQYQFPIYESFLVACVSMAFTWARWSADEDPNGYAIFERGTDSLPSPLRLPARALAAIGFCALVLFVCYHLPFNWISVGGDSLADLPSYLTPTDASP